MRATSAIADTGEWRAGQLRSVGAAVLPCSLEDACICGLHATLPRLVAHGAQPKPPHLLPDSDQTRTNSVASGPTLADIGRIPVQHPKLARFGQVWTGFAQIRGEWGICGVSSTAIGHALRRKVGETPPTDAPSGDSSG